MSDGAVVSSAGGAVSKPSKILTACGERSIVIILSSESTATANGAPNSWGVPIKSITSMLSINNPSKSKT